MGTAVSFLLSELVVLGLLLTPLMNAEWWNGFRTYFSNDQLSYAAIATNVSIGDVRLVEPFTLTGSSFYPSAWYFVVGFASRVTGMPVWLAWTVMGLLIVSAAVAVVGWTGLRLSGRSWAPVLPGAALLVGTYSTQRAGDWMTNLDHHAVLWGPYGTLFTLNGEVAALSLALIGLSLVIVSIARGWRSGRARSIGLVCGVGIVGATANVQTYSFLAATFLLVALVTTYALMAYPGRARLAATVVLMVLVLAAGPILVSAIGPLPLYGLLLLAGVPAVWPAALRHVRLAVSMAVVFAAAASPQVVHTILGLANSDPFLTYRQASSTELGVPVLESLLAMLPLLLVGVACAVVVAARRQPAFGAALVSLLLGVVILANNDRWGFNQEPYRFWLQFEILASLLLTPIAAWSLTQWRPLTRAVRVVAVVAGAAAVLAWGVSLPDARGFWNFARERGVIDATSPQLVAASQLLGDRDGLVKSSACMDPQMLKMAWRGPVAFYNAGLAWPDRERDMRLMQDQGRRGGEDPMALRAAGIRWVLTDSACESEWTFPANQSLIPAGSMAYTDDAGAQKLTVWMVQ